MYLSIKQHDQFRNLLMAFEIPYRRYIANILLSHFSSPSELKDALLAKNEALQPSDSSFLRNTLPKLVANFQKIKNCMIIFPQLYQRLKLLLKIEKCQWLVLLIL